MSARAPSLSPARIHFPEPETRQLDLAALEQLSLQELIRLYVAAEAPVPGVLDGRVRGSVLAGPGIFSLRQVRALANSPLWPWQGKHFDACAGRGTNEFGLGTFTSVAIPFDLQPGRCFDGSGSCMVVSYDLPENPRGQRSKRYEIRQITERLFLSRALRFADAGYELICFYGLEKQRKVEANG